MAIRKRGNSWQIDYLNRIGKRVGRLSAKKRAAELGPPKLISLSTGGKYLNSKEGYNTTLEDILKRYEENYKHQASFINSKHHYIRNFQEYFGKDIHIENISYIHLKTYRNHLRQKPTRTKKLRAIATINREMACLHHILQKAAEWGLIVHNPFDCGQSLLTKENNKRVRFLTETEISKLLSECSKHLRPIVVCALNTGMRKGEILNLEWSQVRDGFIYLGKSKNNEARKIPVNETLQALFVKMDKRRRPGVRNVFTYAKGEHRMKDDKPARKRKGPAPLLNIVQNVRTAFVNALERAGIPDFRFQDLRHTFASHMLMRGASLKDLQELLGHKSMSMVLRYAHLSQEHKRKNM